MFITHSFIHSFIQTISIALIQVYSTTQRRYRHSTDTVPEFHAEAPQATVSEGLAQGPYVEARVGVELMTLRTKGDDSTNATYTPHSSSTCIVDIMFMMILFHRTYLNV